ncbi:hypothetical protein DICPUDRAFT_91755 [Dictyostelium purpureum]|uniref:Dolichyl-diphosphooligosaccharide--protein glycosyltransferase subunit 1 n=1 Tax=Dictyostelium purpureum TaxID=5786 RepID=F0ZGV5_DICPU|nr:uncharacterized protein DICPUDRAFT_91755 [Dictyostelium purpureum]EGC36843.1 hypothetical protein DICPUDRAFT_91755 [Dictyostelium purpureum]|eukprot:XP_003286641.1 hypothetical protein DICPUDRAFT_91755 [Dictyostelium purpureum]
MKIINIVFLFLVVVGLALSNPHHHNTWVNQDVQRSIDLTTQLSKQILSVKAKSLVDNNKNYQISFDNTYHVSVQAFDDKNNELKVHLSPNSINIKEGFNTFDIELNNKYKINEVLSLKLKVTLMSQMKPYPVEIKQGQTQLVLYNDNHYFTSPYKTETQKTTVKLASGKVESFSEIKPSSLKTNTIVYGPFSNVEAFTVSPMRIHFENSAHFMVLTQLKKEYEVSHWGNLAVETSYYLENQGAHLKGPFSRLDYQRNPGANPSHISEINEAVPLSAADFYYRDSIGNISTSVYQYQSNRINFKITPRFPLMGGWKNNFYTGYNLPIQNFLSVDSADGSYHLNVTFGVGIDNIYVEDHQVKIILPEGATDIKVKSPFPVTETREIRKTYLDTVGRPVIVLNVRDTSFENYRYIQVTYNLSSLSIFHEPLLVIGAVFTFCLFIMFYSRFDLSINKSKVN